MDASSKQSYMYNNYEFGIEWKLLELVCGGIEEEKNMQQIQSILDSSNLHWGELMEQAIRHKILPLLADAIISTQQTKETVQDKEVHLKKSIPVMVAKHLKQALDFNKYKTDIFRKYAFAIGKRLEQAGIQYCVTKGISFETTLYKGRGVRNFDHDIDIMVRQADEEKVAEVLASLGYEIGQYDPFKNIINPMPRKELMIYKMYPDHLPPYVALTDDIIGAIGIDFSFSFTWHNSPYTVSLENAFAGTRTINYPGTEEKLRVFDPVYQFIFTALHLFREAWFERWIEFEQDVNLLKFTDMILMWKTYREAIETGDLKVLLIQYDIIAPVTWVLEHLDRTFETDTISTLELQQFVDEKMLFSAYGSNGEEKTWKGSMKKRLYLRNTSELFQ